ncbi:ABC transporter A family member 8 [Dichanthelium oligosanthes]|uniref:ABC transporter A family member 8 n=1 Tax=Dichanthelium oligosanthes TaxID=888268 RepID=A0A1E5VVY3_9POAL|nr:ABC transporter A family member 8 [Dichanthelium oligosanthes]
MGASRLQQTNALFRKNLVIQRRACKTNCCLVMFPLLLCSVIGGMQMAISRSSSPEFPTPLDGCACSNVTLDKNALGGLSCPSTECPLPRGFRRPPVLQIPQPVYRAVGDGLFGFTDLPDGSCRGNGSCAATFLVTGGNQPFVRSMLFIPVQSVGVMDNMFFPVHNASVNLSADVSGLSDFVLATDGRFGESFLQNECIPNLTLSYPIQYGNEIVNQGLSFFRQNSYGVQFIFYFAYMNLQISFAFLMSTYFSSVRTATVTGYLYIVVSGLLAEVLFRSYVEDVFLSRSWITLMELLPAFSLYRIVYEFSQSILAGRYVTSSGIQWIDMTDPKNGLAGVLTIMILEWFLFLLFAFYLDHFGSLKNGIRKAAVLVRSHIDGNHFQAAQQQNTQLQEFRASVEMERTDVIKEREIVEQFLQGSRGSYSVICDNLKKVYRGQDGNTDKIAVRGISLSMSYGQCLGVLGPNGAGKTTLINMLTGFSKPTSGTAYIEGMDIRFDMDRIYTGIGVCPQDDLLWENLTGREHLMFYGRLKKLKGTALAEAIEQSLRSVRLFAGGVTDKLVGKYSGGMKRRLSVAISLIGDPKVVYMDEPSSGLDPASRKDLWKAVKSAKQKRTIILTSTVLHFFSRHIFGTRDCFKDLNAHSMEEAEALCDRIGIIANGSLQCIGSSKELKDRYGGSCVLTVTTPAGKEEEVERLVWSISPAANRVYRVSGTQKFEMPKEGMKISDVFRAMEDAKSWLSILAWDLADTTLEDVFVRVAKESDMSSVT